MSKTPNISHRRKCLPLPRVGCHGDWLGWQQRGLEAIRRDRIMLGLGKICEIIPLVSLATMYPVEIPRVF